MWISVGILFSYPQLICVLSTFFVQFYQKPIFFSPIRAFHFLISLESFPHYFPKVNKYFSAEHTQFAPSAAAVITCRNCFVRMSPAA